MRVTVKTGWTLPQAHILLASGGFDSGVRSSSGAGRSSMAAVDASVMATEGESVHESVHVSDWMCAFAQKSANLSTVWVGVNEQTSF